MKPTLPLLLGLVILSPSMAASEITIEECSLRECVQFRDWFSGSYEFASGKQVFIAETFAYNGSVREHLLSLVYEPGQCDLPRPYFRIPILNDVESIVQPSTGRFRFNAATFFDYGGRLYWPHGRIGTIVIDEWSENVPEFVRLIKYANSLNSINYYQEGGSSFYEYILYGSTAALEDAAARCIAASESEKQAELADNPELLNPVSCYDLGFLSDPVMASSFEYINTRFKNETGKNLDDAGIPYEAVCLDLKDGFSPVDIADGIIQALK